MTSICTPRFESSQEFVNYCIRFYSGENLTFVQLLEVFTVAGELYDQGFRPSNSRLPKTFRGFMGQYRTFAEEAA